MNICDPFVFGPQFHYTGCMQHREGRPTQLRHLRAGSVVLFGSCTGRSSFVLDTVFVACYLPARRVLEMDPVDVLRKE